MDQPTLAYGDIGLAGLPTPLAAKQQRIMINSVLKRLEIRRRALVRQRIYFVLACLLGLVGIVTTLFAGPSSTLTLQVALGLTCYAIAASVLTATTIIHQGQDNLPEILDLIEQNRAALDLLDSTSGAEAGRD